MLPANLNEVNSRLFAESSVTGSADKQLRIMANNQQSIIFKSVQTNSIYTKYNYNVGLLDNNLVLVRLARP